MSKLLLTFVASKPKTVVFGHQWRAGMHIYGKAFTRQR